MSKRTAAGVKAAAEGEGKAGEVGEFLLARDLGMEGL
jgi:hypothetical protein